MEDSEVLLKNDPLAQYIQNLNIPFELDLQDHANTNESLPQSIIDKNMNNIKYKLNQIYRDHILSSQLMFSDDSALVLACSESTNNERCLAKSNILLLLIPISGAIGLLSKSKFVSIVCSSICLLKTLQASCVFAKQQYFKNIICKLIETLKKFTGSIKKYLSNIMQYTTTLNYYCNKSDQFTIGNNLNEHIRAFCKILNETALKLRGKSAVLLNFINLSIQVEILELIEIPDDSKVKHAKILYEYYLLAQSHFLKIAALIFIPELWSSKINENLFSTIFLELKSLTNYISNQMEMLNKKHFTFLHVGEFKSISNISNVVQDQLCASLLTNFQLAEINLHQLIFKIKFLEDLIVKSSSETEITDLYSEIGLTIEEIEKQIDNPKHYVSAASIILQRTLNTRVDTTIQEPIAVNKSVLDESSKNITTISSLTPDPPQTNEVYELFIPKEGLPPVEHSQMEDPLLPCNNKVYSKTLLEELKQLLQERNPEIATEQEAFKKEKSVDESDTVQPEKEIFRPQQPVGLFVNQSLQDILAMRKTIQNEEEFFDDDEIIDD